MSPSKNLPCKGPLRQLFIRVNRLEIQSVMLVFSTQLVNSCPSLWFNSPQPPHPFPVCISILYTCYTVCKEGGGVRLINTCRKVPLQVTILDALVSLQLISLCITLSESSVTPTTDGRRLEKLEQNMQAPGQNSSGSHLVRRQSNLGLSAFIPKKKNNNQEYNL